MKIRQNSKVAKNLKKEEENHWTVNLFVSGAQQNPRNTLISSIFTVYHNERRIP